MAEKDDAAMDNAMGALADATGGKGAVDTVRKERRRRVVPAAIQEVVALGVGAKYDETQEGWVIPGFYRAKGMLIKYNENNTQGVAIPLSNKRIQGQVIKSFEDLVELNYAWWNVSRKESLDYEVPEDGWKDEFVEMEMVERRMLYLPKITTYNPIRQG